MTVLTGEAGADFAVMMHKPQGVPWLDRVGEQLSRTSKHIQHAFANPNGCGQCGQSVNPAIRNVSTYPQSGVRYVSGRYES